LLGVRWDVWQVSEQGQPLGEVRNGVQVRGALRRLVASALPGRNGRGAGRGVVMCQQLRLCLCQSWKVFDHRLGDLEVVLLAGAG
jgi:hypothetical protein